MARPKGWVDWEPRPTYRGKPAKRYLILEAATDLLNRYHSLGLLPLGSRQVAYRIMEEHGIITKHDFPAVEEVLVLMRRSRRIPMDWISDGRSVSEPGYIYESGEDVVATIKAAAKSAQLDRQHGQPTRVDIWLETMGVIGQVERAVNKYGCGLSSSSGFDALKLKFDQAEQYKSWINSGFCERVVIGHLGDCDENGVSIFNTLTEEFSAVLRNLFGEQIVLERVALTREQVAAYNLPEKPPSKDKNGNAKNRGIGLDVEVQLEALDPRTLINITESFIHRHLDLDVYQQALRREAGIRRTLMKAVQEVTFPAELENGGEW